MTLNGYTDSRGRRQIALNWSNDAYPSLEAYYEPGGKNKSPRTVCRSREESIDDLAGAARTRCRASF